MAKITNILFVCTGNIFRSMSGEYMLKKYLKQQKISGFHVSSAGIIAKLAIVDSALNKELKKKGIDVKSHHQRKLTKEILDKNDIVIAMGQNHKDFVWKHRKRRVFLFNELAYHKKTPVLDVEEILSPDKLNEASKDKYEKHVLDHIQKWTPSVFKNIQEKHFLFTDFISTKLRHRNGMPFIPLYETKYTVAFMSIDIPEYEDGHVLIIPKKRFRDMEEIPTVYLQDLMRTIKIVGAVIKQTHTGYNLLLNNGEDAGQYILHMHFHLIPRQEHDHINIEIFKRKKFSPKMFMTYNMLLKGKIEKYMKGKKK